MDQHPTPRRRLKAWLTSAVVALAVFAPTAAQAIDLTIQKPGH